jgi:ABC-2 type transport system permease protein
MSALSGLVRLETIRVGRDRAMLAMVILFALLAGYATFAGGCWAENRASSVAQIASEADETMALRRETFVKTLEKGETPNFGLIYATALPFRASLPNAPLAALSAGQAESYPPAAAIAPFVDPCSIFDRFTTGLESPAILAAGRFDLAFVIVIVLPLLLIAATYDFWSRDVESGRARIQLAQPVRPAALLVTRAALRGGLLLAAMVLLASLMLAFTGGDAVGIIAFATVMLAYGLFWIALATCINLVVRTSTAAALACGTAWLAIVVLLPAGLAAAVDMAARPPSARAYANAIRTAGLEVRAANAAAARAAATAGSGRAYPASLWHSRREIAVRDARLAPFHQRYARAWERRRGLASTAAMLSPSVLAQDALDRIAGTDASRALAFQRQAQAFAGDVRRLAFDWMDADRLMALADYDGGLPRFAFVEPPRMAGIGFDLAAMLLFAAILSGFAALRLRRGAPALL